jgi:hypothetical protein
MYPLSPDIRTLAAGTPRQRAALRAIEDLHLFESLRGFDPVLAGTIPIDLDLVDSDLDILCEVNDPDHFASVTREKFGSCADFRADRWRHGDLITVVVNFSVLEFKFELFGQSRPSREQFGFLHMIAEARMLALSGDSARDAVRYGKQKGLKTEPAFALVFAIDGDPYLELAGLANASETELAEIVRRAGWERTEASGL